MTSNHHPSLGPVSLDRLHQISEILSKAAAQSDGGNLGYAMADAVKVIDGAIAEFEEQDNPRPVMAVKGEIGFIDNLEKIIEERDEDIDIGQLGRSNYDALMIAALDAFRASPQVVPSEMTPIIEDGEIIAYERHGERFSTIVGATWNACRAAMLQSFGNSEQLIKQPSSNSFTDEDLEMMAHGDNPQSNAYRELLVFRRDFREMQNSSTKHFRENAETSTNGWIPCSEQIPEESTDADGGATCYLVLYADGKEPNGGSSVGVWNVTYLRRWWAGFITHWMPLPAAPQQEVKNV